MYPLRIIVLLVTSLSAASLLILAAWGSTAEGNQQAQSGSHSSYASRLSFASPGSLFPPSAIISLTDDNSTFFLARPAAFGPDLLADGLSGPLWVGRGFAHDAPSEAELGCSDVPDWEDKEDEEGEEDTSALNSPPNSAYADRKAIGNHLIVSARAELQGSIALLKRGGCGFLAKVQWAQNRGALAVVVGDDVRGGGLVRMYAKGDTSNVTIPSLFTSHTTAHLLSSLLEPRRAGQNNIASPVQPNTQRYPEDLWITLTPTNMSTSPFFDTLLVLVVSPLVTLTVVYALLLLRSRIRRRRWRAPKSLVERLPVRTYEAISSSSSSLSASTSSSPTAPLLQRAAPDSMARDIQRTSSLDQGSQSRPTSGHQDIRPQEVEKRETGLAEWRRRYGGRQKECVICLEEYVNGVSQVMRLPCGHEFHADCVTPWLVTRRRICPICKGDVVRSLAQSFHERTPSDASTQTVTEASDVAGGQSTTIHGTSSPVSSAQTCLPIETPSIRPSTENQRRGNDDCTVASSTCLPRTTL